jgi:hypothetical protein
MKLVFSQLPLLKCGADKMATTTLRVGFFCGTPTSFAGWAALLFSPAAAGCNCSDF